MFRLGERKYKTRSLNNFNPLFSETEENSSTWSSDKQFRMQKIVLVLLVAALVLQVTAKNTWWSTGKWRPWANAVLAAGSSLLNNGKRDAGDTSLTKANVKELVDDISKSCSSLSQDPTDGLTDDEFNTLFTDADGDNDGVLKGAELEAFWSTVEEYDMCLALKQSSPQQ